jgi:hypothetical protein
MHKVNAHGQCKGGHYWALHYDPKEHGLSYVKALRRPRRGSLVLHTCGVLSSIPQRTYVMRGMAFHAAMFTYFSKRSGPCLPISIPDPSAGYTIKLSIVRFPS